MANKFCQNHLIELYEAIKTNNLQELELVEHELTSTEECVACAYAFKARGEVKDALTDYLKSQGFLVGK